MITLVLQLVLIYVPFCQRLFGTQALPLSDLLLCLVLSTVVFWAVEAEKLWKRRGTPRDGAVVESTESAAH